MNKSIKNYIHTEETTSLATKLDPLLFETILNQFPYSLNVTSLDGTMVYANQKFLDKTFDSVKSTAIGHYNILKEVNCEQWGLSEHIQKAFQGQIITTKMLKFPMKELVDIRYGKESGFINLYQDITSFPIFDTAGNLTHVVTTFIPSEMNFKRAEVMSTKEYIESHWVEPLSIARIAKHANLSISRLRTLFKEETGFTIHEYYHHIKMQHICEVLKYPDLSISAVFIKCGVAYNSYYVSLFKSFSGMSPREYRVSCKR